VCALLLGLERGDGPLTALSVEPLGLEACVDRTIAEATVSEDSRPARCDPAVVDKTYDHEPRENVLPFVFADPRYRELFS
jgi:hypothetical protein